MRLFAILLFVVFSLPAMAQEMVNRDDLLDVFKEYQTSGTFMVLEGETGRMTVVGADRANKRFIPASTFKIINSLIALETGVIADENEVVPYGGKPQPFKTWEKDMSIRDGIRISNVPVFQEIARRVGLQRYAESLNRLEFGNKTVGDNVERFWLGGPLKISAVEYVWFLAKLAKGVLPASADNQRIVRDIIRLGRKGDAVLYGKTGWAIAPNPDIGWFVGWVKQKGQIIAFALNMDMAGRSDAPKREAIARALLSELGVY